eukprot:scaffold207_cov409-Prasinococcus_capsulatus_cf.AAC.21
MAATAASQMGAGVSKSGSPAASPITRTPSSFIDCALSVMATAVPLRLVAQPGYSEQRLCSAQNVLVLEGLIE